MNPRGARVLVTGASAGIGAATARAFAQEACPLFLVARRADQLEEVAAECRRNGSPQVICSTHDLSRPGEGAAIIRKCLEELGGLEILVSNAGYGLYGPVADIAPEEMHRQWQVNFQSGFESIHTALPHLLAQARGHIILVSSIIGKKALPYSAAYCVTKFAQVALGESLWGELRGRGIGVTTICPGFTSTEFHQSIRQAGQVRPYRRPFKGQAPEVVARGIVEAVRRNRREVHFTLGGKVLLFFNRIAPDLTNWAVAKAVGRQQPHAGLNA